MNMRNEPATRRKALKISEEAAAWLYELRAENPQRLEEYLDWLMESPQHVEAFLRVSEADAWLGRMDPQRSIAIEPAEVTQTGNVVPLAESAGEPRTTPSARNSARHKRKRSMYRTLAASLVLGVMATAFWMLRPDGPAHWTTYQTNIGEQRAIRLDDGSLLHLNTASRVDVNYSSDERKLRLIGGEALFRVQRDPVRPFRVHSGDAVIQAVGTQFNVLRGPRGSTVSVLEGRVSVDGTLLGAGEQVKVTNKQQVTAPARANLARVSAWRQRRLIFMNDTLGDIAAEFNRYNRAPRITVEGAAAMLRDYETLSFEADDPESFLAVLERDGDLKIERRADSVVVRRRSE